MIFKKNIFSNDECQKIINYTNNGLNPCRYTINAPIKPQCFELTYNDITKWIYDKIYNTFNELIGIEYYDVKVPFSILKYNEGFELEYHVHKTVQKPNTKWIVAVLLNDDFKGGEHICYDEDNNKINFDFNIGDVVFYESFIPHEVTTIFEGVRWSMVREIEITKKNYLI